MFVVIVAAELSVRQIETANTEKEAKRTRADLSHRSESDVMWI